LRADLLLCFKVVNKLIAVDFSDFFELENNKYSTRGHKFKLRIPKICNKIRKKIFSIRIFPVWNYLPAGVVSSPSVSLFKRQLMSVKLNNYLVRKHDIE
jgi:hypothetical protein